MKKKLLIVCICAAVLALLLVPVSCVQTNTESLDDINVPPGGEDGGDGGSTGVWPEILRITPAELKQKLDADPKNVIVLDTRDLGSYAYGHIPGAANFEWDPVGDPMELNMKLWTLPADKLIVTYCACEGEETSGAMAERVIDEVIGIKREMVKALRGGIDAWKSAGYPLATGETLEGGKLNP